MIAIEYERYWNDYTRQKKLTKSFSSLSSLANWLFDMNTDPNGYGLYFGEGLIESKDEQGWTIWVRIIRNENGIIFSDGRYTMGQKHCNDTVKEWVSECMERKNHPVYNFV